MVVFDLDGTLRDSSHRMRFIEGPKKDWDSFFKASVDDPPIPHMIENLHHVASKSTVAVWTGCSAKVYDGTVDWLADQRIYTPLYEGPMVPINYSCLAQFRMRPENDFRPDTELKVEWFNNAKRAGSFKVDLMLDDRKRVVDALRAAGATVLHVGDGGDF